MSHLFETSEINDLELKNRIIRSATWTGMADETGKCTGQLIQYYESLAQGGVGLIVTGHTYVMKSGQAGPRQLGIGREEAIPMLRALTEAVHSNGSRIIMQLSHAGMYADPQLTGMNAKAVSASKRYTPYRLKELTSACIEEIVQAFAAGAQHAEAAGFDGVQIHAGHGYLLSQFLSPAYNVRTDGFGGALENRAKPLLDVVRRIRKALGRHYPLLVKLNCQDFLDDGMTMEESQKVAVILEQEGVDAIEVSGGTRESGRFKSTRTDIFCEKDEAYFEQFARSFKQHLSIPIALVGGIRRHETAVRLLGTGAADYIAMSRPFIREPGFVKRWQSGNTAMVGCISDNECLGMGLRSGGIRCSHGQD